MHDLAWTQAGAAAIAAFLASAVEFVEALVVVLAVGHVRGWRSAWLGVGSALAVLVLAVTLAGSTLARLPAAPVRLIMGVLLLLFGLRWLRKAVLRAAGIIKLHDEAASYAKHTDALRGGSLARAWDAVAIGTAFQITLIEGAEVVFIVVTVAAHGTALLLAAASGAVAALLIVLAAGAALHRRLDRVPENALKMATGVLLSALGSFWIGEALGVVWPAADGSIVALVLMYAAAAWLGVFMCRRRKCAAGRGMAA